jgi:nitrate/nitrite-specific signal transduction histidine kinase
MYFATTSIQASVNSAVEAQSVLVEALRVARNVSEQVRDAREIIVFGIDEHDKFELHGANASEAFVDWEKRLGESEDTENKQDVLDATANEYNVIDSRLDQAINLYDLGNRNEAAAELNEVLTREYENNFLPAIEDMVSKERKNVADAKKNADSTSVLIRLAVFIIAVAVCMAVWFFATIVMHDILVSTQSLKEAAEKIGKGDLDIHIEIDKDDEFGELARSFNEMAARLRESSHYGDTDLGNQDDDP